MDIPDKILKKVFFLAWLCVTLTACSGREALVLWVANTETTLYRSPAGDELNQIGKIEAGVVCVTGKNHTEKAFQYFEVLCQTGQYGWIADPGHFKEIRHPN